MLYQNAQKSASMPGKEKQLVRYLVADGYTVKKQTEKIGARESLESDDPHSKPIVQSSYLNTLQRKKYRSAFPRNIVQYSQPDFPADPWNYELMVCRWLAAAAQCKRELLRHVGGGGGGRGTLHINAPYQFPAAT